MISSLAPLIAPPGRNLQSARGGPGHRRSHGGRPGSSDGGPQRHAISGTSPPRGTGVRHGRGDPHRTRPSDHYGVRDDPVPHSRGRLVTDRPSSGWLQIGILRLHRGLTENRVETDREAADPRLRSRTYAVPFDGVWTEALRLADGGLARWSVIRADDARGEIEAEARTLLLRLVDDVRVTIRLDENAQTRVDVSSRSRKGRGDFGTNARRVHRFLTRLDRRVAGAAERKG